ncbi:MAG: aegerolysin family protein, partial [Methylococcaceae bacterium]|nr:aegerolysin family protein [Methylococcaceae bacterium]
MSARSTQIFFHNDTGFALTKIEEELPHGEWGHDGGQRPPASIAPNSTAEMGSDSSGFLTGTEGRVRYRIEDGNSSSVYFHWDNPYDGTNKYHQFTGYDFEVFHTGGSGNNTVVDVFLRVSVRHDARGFRPDIHGFPFSNSWGDVPYSLPPLKGSILDYKYGNARNGLCGGMVNTVRDYFESETPIPTLQPRGE